MGEILFVYFTPEKLPPGREIVEPGPFRMPWFDIRNRLLGQRMEWLLPMTRGENVLYSISDGRGYRMRLPPR